MGSDFEKYFFVIATAQSPKNVNGNVLQVGALYSFKGRLIPDSVRTSGVEGDSFSNQNKPKLQFHELLKIILSCIRSNRILFNSDYLGPWFSVFGHFLFETISRIKIDTVLNRNTLLFHTMDSSLEHQKVLSYQERIFKILDLDTDKIKILTNKPFLLINVRIFKPKVEFPRLINPDILEVHKKIQVNAFSRQNLGDKIYLSRSGLHPLHQRLPLLITSQLEAVLENMGFKVVHPESLTIDDQISVVSHARILAGPQGSALHLSVFCKSDIKVIEFGDSLRPSAPNPFQNVICRTFGQDLIFFPYDPILESFNIPEMKSLLSSLI